MVDRKFLTVAEAALTIGIEKRSAQRLVAAGCLLVVRFSARVFRVPVAALNAMSDAALAAALAAIADMTDPASAEAS